MYTPMVDGFRWIVINLCVHEIRPKATSVEGYAYMCIAGLIYLHDLLAQLPKTQASNSKNSVPMIDGHFYNSFAWIESRLKHSDCHFSWAWPVSRPVKSHALGVRHTHLGSISCSHTQPYYSRAFLS